jgi:hypothetical protein
MKLSQKLFRIARKIETRLQGYVVKVQQARGREVQKYLSEQNIDVLESGYTDGSTTWSMLVSTKLTPDQIQDLIYKKFPMGGELAEVKLAKLL